jgi:hypothetical protein
LEEGNTIGDSSQASFGVDGSTLSSDLMQLLMATQITPGSKPSYELCKVIYTAHPLGAKMADGPLDLALSQEREIVIPGAPEEDLVKAFTKEWNRLGVVGANTIIKNVMKQSRIYGIASLIVGCRGSDPAEALTTEQLATGELYFNAADPLNTAGSLVLNQDPNAPDYQKPQSIRVNGQVYHPSNTVTMMNEQPIYISWTNSAFGFVGRSCYQRGLFPLKSFVQTMIMNDLIAVKAGAIIYKTKSPGSFIDKVAKTFYKAKASLLKFARNGNVMTIGLDEAVESLDLRNIHDAAKYARDNILKDIATSDGMPAMILNQDTMAEGFGEGTEDAKNLSRYIDGKRIEMAPLYKFLDDVVRRRAWTPEFYKTIQTNYPDTYAGVPFDTAFVSWCNAFSATWPNLLEEPDSEKVKVDQVIMTAAIAGLEVIIPALDPDNKATAIMWLADVMNSRKLLFSDPLVLDYDKIAAYVPALPDPTAGMESLKP